ncbi:DUF1543 domain-containing protein [Pedobacter sp. L105]|uniref:DUF1543 domain-containing protein n=1 Tax=Pedobacter sp. L105 TaxID=1641871 RepID=UPI001C2025CC|nr:DUF1543 domain-containing protein [Pedobacter sp. L105]
MKLYMLLVGCTPPGRYTEQHDVLFTIGEDLNSIVPDVLNFWPEADGKIHVDAWREVTSVDGYRIEVVEKDSDYNSGDKLFFLNLGGYKPGEFEEPHYKMLVIEKEKSAAIKRAKETAFYQHTGFEGAPSHVDDKYGVDVDDVFEIEDVLSPALKEKFSLSIFPAEGAESDEFHLGYLPLQKM